MISWTKNENRSVCPDDGRKVNIPLDDVIPFAAHEFLGEIYSWSFLRFSHLPCLFVSSYLIHTAVILN
jgi:hypothetical protein